MVAVQKRVGTEAGTFAYTYSDHLGNLVALSSLTGVLDATSLARYDPFGNFRTTPATNPGTTNHGFTGHRHNNTGTNNLGLIYMNARYYLPEVGRFVSPDTIVPEPGNPQSHNRYAYAYNDPVNLVDPSGHCINNYEIGSTEMDTCVAAWNAVMNYMDGVFFGTGDFPDEAVNDWLMNADITLLEKLMESWGISYGYTWTPLQSYIASGSSGGKSLTSPEFTAGMCDYWQSCYQPVTDYIAIVFD